MMRYPDRRSALRCLSSLGLGLTLAALTAAPALADHHTEATTPGASAAPNVKLTVRLGRLDGDTRKDVKSYDLIVISGGVSARLLSGARIPIPTRRTDGESPSTAEAANMTYVYQNVGFSTEAHAWVLDDGRIKVVATLEDSSIEELPDDHPPTVETRQLSVQAILTPGVPLEVTRIEGIRDSSGFVEIEAEIVR